MPPKRHFLLLITMLLSCAFAASGISLPLRWRWSNPTPHGGNIFGMAYGLGLTVEVTERGQIFTSEDLDFWQPRDSHTTNTLLAATFFGNRVIVAGEQGTIVYADSLENFQYVDLQTSNWLTAVDASTNLVVAVGDRGSIYSSTNGATWTKESVSFTNWLRGVTFGNNMFVAVGENGLIALRGSSGGWTTQTSGTTRHLNSVSFINNQFYAVGEGGVTLKANNSGKAWTPVTGVGTTNTLYAAVPDDSNSILLVGDEALRLQSSSAWVDQFSASTNYPAPAWTYYGGVWEDSLYLIGGHSGMMVQGFSTNAANPPVWIPTDDSIRNWLWDVVALPNLYVAVGDHATVMTSGDGIGWDLEYVPNNVTNTIFLGVGGTTNGLLAVGNRGNMIFSPNTITNVVVTNAVGTNTTTTINTTSTLGVKWQLITAATTNDLQGVTTFGNKYVVCGSLGTILTSTNTTNWTAKTPAPTTAFLSSAVSISNLIVLTGDRGVILTSSDATNWTARTSGTTNWIYRVRYLNGQFIAVGENGTILTSSNGLTWTKQTSGTTQWLNGIEFILDTYFVVGNQGTVLISTNLTNWSNIGTITQKSLYGAASQNGQLIAVGIEGAIVRSQVTPIMDPVQILNYSRASNQNVMLISGKADQRFTLQEGSNLTNWNDAVTLEISDRSGTLLYLQNVDTNAMPQDFLRARVVP